MHGNKDAVNTDERYPKVEPAEAFAHEAAKHLWKPEVGRGKHPEDRSHTHYQVKVTQHDIGVVQWQIERALSQEQAADATGYKQRHKAKRKQHGGGETNSGAPERAYPIECLNCRWHTDRQSQNRKRHGRIRAHAADKHVMAPYKEAQETNSEDREDHRAITKDGFACKRGQDVRGGAHTGQNRDVNLGMTKEPEQVLPEDRRTTCVQRKPAVDS